MARITLALSFLVLLILGSPALAQIDQQGTDFAWQLYRAQESGDSAAVQQMIGQDPQMVKRAFLATIVYAFMHQSEPETVSSALGFANSLATYIAQNLGDPNPLALMQRVTSQDPSVASDFFNYAASIYPGYAQYANGGGGSYPPGGNSFPPGNGVYPPRGGGYPPPTDRGGPPPGGLPGGNG